MSRQASKRYWFAQGSGPGVITADGCAVDCYALLPAGSEPDLIHSTIPAGASILELGAGTGRLTHPLIGLSHQVVAVDESPAMLARIHGAQRVCSPIETLALQRRFDVVLLASHLVNAPDDDLRRGFLRACSRHVDKAGCVLIQRHDPAWFDTASSFQRSEGEITFRMRDVSRPTPGLLAATMEYQVGDKRWTHSFITRCIDDAQLTRELAGAGLAVNAYLTEDRTWVRAVRR
jgi:SAM-dependent methyltransferase